MSTSASPLWNRSSSQSNDLQNPSEPFEALLSAEEAAEHLRMHVKTVQRFARERRIPCVRMGKYWRFRLSALDHWVLAQQNQVSQPFLVSDKEKP